MSDKNTKKTRRNYNIALILCLLVFVVSVVLLVMNLGPIIRDRMALSEQQDSLAQMKEQSFDIYSEEYQEEEGDGLSILPEYRTLYQQNPDIIGWLKINDTSIDYPVMQTLEDEQFYLRRDFYGKDNKNGCLIMDDDSVVGVGNRAHNYEGGVAPSTNLLIHGHTMKTGAMFGKLNRYKDQEYGEAHRYIQFDSLYEHREYEVMAAFYTQIYGEDEDVFKYYNFFQANSEDEFNEWYSNVKALAIYDTGVEASFGDEFITLSCCAYHVEDGRFVVVARRVK